MYLVRGISLKWHGHATYGMKMARHVWVKEETDGFLTTPLLDSNADSYQPDFYWVTFDLFLFFF